VTDFIHYTPPADTTAVPAQHIITIPTTEPFVPTNEEWPTPDMWPVPAPYFPSSFYPTPYTVTGTTFQPIPTPERSWVKGRTQSVGSRAWVLLSAIEGPVRVVVSGRAIRLATEKKEGEDADPSAPVTVRAGDSVVLEGAIYVRAFRAHRGAEKPARVRIDVLA